MFAYLKIEINGLQHYNSKNLFGILKLGLIHLHQFFKSLIKKGRGIWPVEALATQASNSLV
jgi:hypothetical protein